MFVIFVMDENDKYTVKLTERGETLRFNTFNDALAYARAQGLKYNYYINKENR